MSRHRSVPPPRWFAPWHPHWDGVAAFVAAVLLIAITVWAVWPRTAG